ncbi:hypothetical protein H5410_047483 [Solanum commersonii]|uniref:Uncharacterized protein n=1 Tax=Solanum commersonii TaxID=4109 RepID=A0A9J5XF91_SOLCO|nr:hypothetical protein H5410_047483 [Solanum commersonii]
MALFQTNVRFLGHNIERGSISPINRSIEFASKFPDIITDKTQLQRFLGSLNYVAPFIKDLAKDTAIIYDRLKKNPKAWSNDHTEAIRRIKEKQIQLEKSGRNRCLDLGYSGVLTQYCPDTKRHYIGDLYNQKFLIKIDCQATKFMFNKDCKHDVSKQMFARWQALLAPFDFEIHYKKGEDNRNKTLTSFNVSQTTASSSSGTSGGVDINHPMYKEFMDFMKSKKETSSSTYSSVLIDDENIEVYDMNSKKEVILLLEESDLRWRNEP